MRNHATSAMSAFCIQSRWSRPNRAKPSLSHDVLALVVVGEDHICGQRIIAIRDRRREKQRHHYLRHSMCRNGVSGAECVTHRILRDNDGRMRRMICQACPQNDDVSIGNICHVPVSSHLGSYLITTARWSPERTLVIKDKAQGAFVQRRRRTFLGGTEFSRQPSNRRQAPSQHSAAPFQHSAERANDGHESHRVFCQCSASAAGTFQVSGSNQSTVSQNIPSAKVGTLRSEKSEQRK
jgi:hypothetical protein